MNKNGESQGASFLADSVAITTLLATLLYTAGWSFAYHYFDQFHLGLIGLDIPKEYFFVYSFWVIKGEFYMAAAGLAATVLLYFLLRYCFLKAEGGMKNKKQNLFLALGLFLTPLVVLGLFRLFYDLGDRRAVALFAEQQATEFPSYPKVKVWLTEKAAAEMEDMAKEWAKGSYRLLLRDKEYLYLFYFEKGEINPTEIIPMGNVQAVRVLP